MNRRLLVSVAFLAVFSAGGLVTAAAAADAPTTWDGMVRVKSKALRYVYLLPGADFRAYHKVMIDPTEVAFDKNWMRDYNSTTRSRRVTDSEVQKAIDEGGKAATDLFTKSYAGGGYAVVTTPGPDVLRIRTAVVNLRVTAPDVPTAGRSMSYSSDSGSATLVVEARDSVTGALLGRAIDSQMAGDSNYMLPRSSVINRADFEQLGRNWAKRSVKGLDTLKTMSPIDASGAHGK
jgi:hypothetical protein